MEVLYTAKHVMRLSILIVDEVLLFWYIYNQCYLLRHWGLRNRIQLLKLRLMIGWRWALCRICVQYKHHTISDWMHTFISNKIYKQYKCSHRLRWLTVTQSQQPVYVVSKSAIMRAKTTPFCLHKTDNKNDLFYNTSSINEFIHPSISVCLSTKSIHPFISIYQIKKIKKWLQIFHILLHRVPTFFGICILQQYTRTFLYSSYLCEGEKDSLLVQRLVKFSIGHTLSTGEGSGKKCV